MKIARFFAVILGVLGLVLMVGSAVLCFDALDAPVQAEVPEAVEECAAEVAALLCEGDLDAVSEMLYGKPDLGTDAELTGETARVWEIFCEGISCELVSQAYVSGSSFAMDAVLTVPDIAGITDTVTAHAKRLLEERIAAAEKMAELYDENGDYRQDVIDGVMAQAVELSFAEKPEMLTFETTLSFAWQGKQWYAVPDAAFMQALAGGLD